MKESLKKHWKGITATVVAFGVVCSSIYYVNCVYLSVVAWIERIRKEE